MKKTIMTAEQRLLKRFPQSERFWFSINSVDQWIVVEDIQPQEGKYLWFMYDCDDGAYVPQSRMTEIPALPSQVNPYFSNLATIEEARAAIAKARGEG